MQRTSSVKTVGESDRDTMGRCVGGAILLAMFGISCDLILSLWAIPTFDGAVDMDAMSADAAREFQMRRLGALLLSVGCMLISISCTMSCMSLVGCASFFSGIIAAVYGVYFYTYMVIGCSDCGNNDLRVLATMYGTRIGARGVWIVQSFFAGCGMCCCLAMGKHR
jgi:hypothetical protein